MKKWIFIILSFVLFIPNVYALEDCTPTDEYLEYLKLPEDIKKEYIPPIECQESIDVNKNYSLNNNVKVLELLHGASPTDTRYSSVDDGLVTPIQDQGNDGTCWAFSAMSVVETNAKKNGLPSYNLSELHMIYSVLSDVYTGNSGLTGRYNATLEGGKISYPASYFFNNKGMLLEEEMPYPIYGPQDNDTLIDRINPDDYTLGHNILTVDKFEMLNINNSASCSGSEIYIFKKYISDYGSVQATIHMPSTGESYADFFKENKYYNYYIKSGSFNYTNHAITIVGWDDSISKDKFINATRDGAWIVKNSWGTGFGDNGYYYVSYDDINICQDAISYQGVSSTNYDYTYTSADLVGVSSKYFNPHSFIASKQTKKSSEDEVIKKVSFATPYSGFTTDVNVYVSFASDWQTNYESWKLLGTYKGNALGIDSIYTDMPIESDEYTIIIEYNNRTSFQLLITKKSDLDTAHLPYESNQNYYSENNQSSWKDSAFYNDFEPNLFVYTNKLSSELSSINIESTTYSNGGIVVNYNNPDDLEIDNIKIFNKNNIDVTDSFGIVVTESNIVIDDSSDLLGLFDIVITDENGKKCILSYEFIEDIKLPSSYTLDKDLSLIIIPPSSSYTNVSSGITISNYDYQIKNGDQTINDGTIGTGYSLVTPNNTYYFIIVGDSTGDGIVNSGDLMKIVKYLKGTITLNDVFQMASDANNDGNINSGDLMKIVKYLKGLTTL